MNLIKINNNDNENKIPYVTIATTVSHYAICLALDKFIASRGGKVAQEDEYIEFLQKEYGDAIIVINSISWYNASRERGTVIDNGYLMLLRSMNT